MGDRFAHFVSLLPLLLCLQSLISSADARPQYLKYLPNADRVSCPSVNTTGCANGFCQAFGHGVGDVSSDCAAAVINPPANDFGNDFLSLSLNLEWTEALCTADSDGDGEYNGLELGDPCCVWERKDDGVDNPPWRTKTISHPGNRYSTSGAAPCFNTDPQAAVPTVDARRPTTIRLKLNDPSPCVCRYLIDVTPTADVTGNATLHFDMQWQGTLATVYGLQTSTSYDIVVKGKNFDRPAGPSSIPITVVTTDSSPPDVPLNPRVGNITDVVVMEWDPPLEGGGLPITKYIMKLDLKEIEGDANPSWTFDNLEPKATYVFRVSAVNSKGRSLYSNAITFRTTDLVAGSSTLVPMLFVILALIVMSIVL